MSPTFSSYIRKYDITIKFFIYFIGLNFLNRINSITSWTVFIVFPLILWGRNINLRFPKQMSVIKLMLQHYLIFAAMIVFTAFFSQYGFITPFTRFVTICLLAMAISLSFVELDSREKVIMMLDGAIAVIFIVSIYLFVFFFNGFVFVLNLDDESWGNRNTAGNVLLLGFIFSVLRSNISGKKWLFWTLSSYFLLCLIFATSMKNLVVSGVIYFYYIFCLRKTIPNNFKVLFIVLLLLSTSAITIAFNEILSSSEDMQRVVDRLLIFTGNSDYATHSYDFYGQREGLMKQTIALFYDNPILGTGLENSRLLYGTYSHNTYIELLAGGGIVLIIPFLFFLGAEFIYLIKKDNYSSYLLIIFLCVFYVSNANRIYDSPEHIFILFTLALCKPYAKKIS